MSLVGKIMQKRWFRFALVGVANTSIDFVGFLLLRAGGLDVLPANTISTLAGLTFSFFVNRTFTFRVERRQSKKQLTAQASMFLGVTGVGLWVLQPLIILSTAGLFGRLIPAPWVDVLGKAAAITVGLAWNYALYGLLVFRAKAVADDLNAIETVALGAVPLPVGLDGDAVASRPEPHITDEKKQDDD